MRKITKTITMVILLILLSTTLTGCVLNPFSVEGKTYGGGKLSYELSESGIREVELWYGENEEAFIDSLNLERFVNLEVKFDLYGEGYYILEGARMSCTWIETGETARITTVYGEQLTFEKELFSIRLNVKNVTGSYYFDKCEVVYTQKLF